VTNPRHFSKEVQRQSYARANGSCEACSAQLSAGNIQYDHRIPWATGRDSSLSNCQILCKTCHSFKSAIIDAPRIAKGVRIADRHVGIRKLSSRPMPASRNSGFKKTMRGQLISRMNLGQMLRQMGLVK
jgi:5-methylcytosine-specific restriction enzyme A